MGTVTIRDAEPGDIETILRVTERAWNAAYGDVLAQETIDTTMAGLRDGDVTRQLVEREDVAYFVAKQHDVVVGYISEAPSDEENVALLGALYVDPDHWNDGIGTALLWEFEAFCSRRNAERIRFASSRRTISRRRSTGSTATPRSTSERRTASVSRSLNASSGTRSSDAVARP